MTFDAYSVILWKRDGILEEEMQTDEMQTRGAVRKKPAWLRYRCKGEWIMKSKKKKLISVTALVIAVILAAGLPMLQWAAGRNSYLKVIRNNWGISLPAGCLEIHEADSGPSFHGDGERYHVFEYWEGKEVPVWGNTGELQEADRELITGILDRLDGKKEWYPDFGAVTDVKKEKKQDGSCVYFLFDKEAARLYVVERFI